MNKNDPPFLTPFQMVNSFFMPVCFVFLLEPVIIASRFQAVSALPVLGLVFQAALVLLRVMIYSGIYGSLLLLASGEEWTISPRQFMDSAKRAGGYYLAVFVWPVMAHLIIFFFYPRSPFSLKHFFAILEPCSLFLLSYFLIGKFYGPILGKKQRLTFQARDFFFLAALCCVQFATDVSAHSVAGLPGGIIVCLVFIARYLHLTVFVLFIQKRLDQYPAVAKKFRTGKEVVFIHPMGGQLLTNMMWSVFQRTPPAAFTILQAQTPSGYRVRILNRRFFHKRYLQEGKLVAITCLSANCADAYQIAKQYKACGSRVIMGGPHVSALPEEAKEYCDSVVIGFSEGLWPRIIRDYEQGSLQPVYDQPLTPEAFAEAVPDLLNMPAKTLHNCLEMTRGCKFRCEFCSIPGLSPFGILRRPVEENIRLLEKFKGYKASILFQDNNIYSDPSYAKELFKQMIPLKLSWTSFASLDIAKDDEALALARESGCVKLEFGYEIPPGSGEAQREKKLSLASQYVELTKKVQKIGIDVRGHFTFGFDGDTWQSFWHIARSAFQLQLYVCAVGILTPFPGTALYGRLLSETRILNANWNNYDGMHLVFRHKNLKPLFMVSQLFRYGAGLYFLTCCRKGQALLLLILVMGLFLLLS